MSRQRRVAITGMGGVTALGSSWSELGAALREGRSGIQRIDEYAEIEGLRCHLGGRIDDFELPRSHPRKKTRSMGRVARLATRASELAIESAGLQGSDLLRDGRMGIAYGSSSGSPEETIHFAAAVGAARSLKGLLPYHYLRFMSQTCVANLAQFFEIRGRILPTCSACTSGSQAIGQGYEQIRFGLQDRMLCGGAEELHVSELAVFDIMQATSTRNASPESTPRPFDRDRDGLVIAEGAATLVLEDLDLARQRGVEILAEVVGYGTNCDGLHIVSPDASGMEQAMRLALEDAALAPEEIQYVSAHATATEVGDVAESIATQRVFGSAPAISSLKGHLGHTLGACGAIEAWATVEMMREGWLAPTLNLERVDPDCADLDYIQTEPRSCEVERAMSNNFAFGGVNTSLIFSRQS